MKIGDLKKFGGKTYKLFAIATSKTDAERDKRILNRHGYNTRINSGKGYTVLHGRKLGTTLYYIWGCKPS